MFKYKDLALYRRAITTMQFYKPETLAGFIEHIGCESSVANPLFRRLEDEGFVRYQSSDLAKSGISGGRSAINRKGKGKAKLASRPHGKAKARDRYIFVQSSTRTHLYKDYFSPASTVEDRLTGLSDLMPSVESNKKGTSVATKAQDSER